MIEEQFVSFDTARLLKAAGFGANLKTKYVEEELADACIRLLDLAGLRKANLSITDKLTIRDVPFTEFVYCLCAYITNPDKSHSDWLSEHISYSLSRLFSWCRYKDIDILWHTEQKMKYNELRPYKHGDKSY